MAKKTSSASGGTVAADTAKILKAAKKKDHNFALFRGDAGFVFKADPIKSMSAMRKAAKDEGATPKGAVGVLSVKGKVATLTVEDPDSTPANFAKAFRKHLMGLKIQMNVVLAAASGDVIDAASDETDGADVELATDVDDALAAVIADFDAFKPDLAAALKAAPDGLQAKIKQAVVFYQKAIAAKSPAKAAQAIDALRTLTGAVASTAAVAGKVTEAAVDPAKLGALSGKVSEWQGKAATDPNFMRGAYKQMSSLRAALKSSIAITPPPPNIDELNAMKAALDDMFYANVDQPPRAHGPECHGPGLTMQNQRDRVLNKVNPRTGAKAKTAVKNGSNFTDKAAYVEAELHARDAALAKISTDGLVPPPKGARPERVVITAKLEDVLGPDWASKVQGVERLNGDKNGPVVDSVFTAGSSFKAIYDLLDDGSLRLVTLYPAPATAAPAPVTPPAPATTPAPAPTPAPAKTVAKPPAKRKRRPRPRRDAKPGNT